MPSVTRITDHADRAVARLLRQFKGKPKLDAFLRALIGPVQDLEDGLWQVYTETIDTAIGVGLDFFGSLAGYPRNHVAGDTSETDDDVYRARIRAKFLANNSDGTSDDLWTLLDTLFASTLTAHNWISRNAASVWYFEEVIDAPTRNLACKFLGWAQSDAVRVILEYQFEEDDDSFYFATISGGVEVAGTGEGWDDPSDAAEGGYWADARIAG